MYELSYRKLLQFAHVTGKFMFEKKRPSRSVVLGTLIVNLKMFYKSGSNIANIKRNCIH